MADTAAEYIAANDNAADYSTSQVESVYNEALEEIDDLMHNVEGRDAELWDHVEVNPEDTVQDFDSVERDERGLDWVIGFSGVAAAATLQFFLDKRQKLIINPSAYRAQVVGTLELTKEQLIIAGSRKTEFVSAQRYQKLEKEFLQRFENLNRLQNKELYDLLVSIKGLRPMESQMADAAGYVSRMTNYQQGSPQFTAAVADLVDVQSKRGLTNMNRRSVEGLSVFDQTGGDLETLMVWILDAGAKHCNFCPARAGEVMTLGEWEQDGLPGADVCAGGDRCRCHLASFTE
jgi:hypothetical protein